MSELALNNGGVVAVNEKRSRVEALNNWKIKSFEKMEQQQAASNTIDKVCDIAKGVVEVLGTGLTIVLAICPLDGPFGEWATAIATPAVVAAIEAGRNLLKTSLVDKNPEQMSAAFSDLSGRCEQIEMPDTNMVRNVGPNERPLNPSINAENLTIQEEKNHTIGGM